MKRFFKVIWLPIMAVLFISAISACSSNELNQSQAEEMLKDYVGDEEEVRDLVSGFMVRQTYRTYRDLEKKGILNLQKFKRTMYGTSLLATFPEDIKKKYVLSTETKGKTTIDGKTYSTDVNKVLLGKASFKKLTGIRQEAGEARVEYIVRMEVTPFGQVMLLDSQKGDIPHIARFERYDDGWRITSAARSRR